MMKNGSTEVARSQECSNVQGRIGMAERVGFEPTVRFPARSLSRRVLSTAQPPLRGRCRFNRSRALRFSAIKPSICAEEEQAGQGPRLHKLKTRPNGLAS